MGLYPEIFSIQVTDWREHSGQQPDPQPHKGQEKMEITA